MPLNASMRFDRPVIVFAFGLPLIDHGLACGADLFGELPLREPKGSSDCKSRSAKSKGHASPEVVAVGRSANRMSVVPLHECGSGRSRRKPNRPTER